MKKLFYLLIPFVFAACTSDPLDEMSLDNISLDQAGVAYGSGSANHSTVQSPDKPTVYSTRYYPSGTSAAAINSAIDAANAAGGGTVELSDTTYSLDEQITMKSNVRLLGQGIGSTILTRGSGFQTSTSGYFIGAYDAGVTDVEIRSMSIDGGYSRAELEAEPTVLVGIGFKSGLGSYNTRVRVIFCEVEGFSIGIQMSGTTHITVQSSDIHDNGGTYLHHNIYFRRIGHVLIYKNKIYDSVAGSGLKLAGGTTNVPNESRYFTIRDNDINNNERINLNIQGCHHLLIEDNELEGQNASGSNLAGMFLRSYNGYQCRYTDIINNSIIGNTSNGVYVEGCRTFNIEGNSVNNNGTNYNIISSTQFSCDYNN